MADANGNTRPRQAQSAAQHENPHFKFIERGSYEVGKLLRNLPARSCAHALLADDDRQMAEAAAKHAGNGIETLLHGLEAIGGIMVDAGMDEDYQMGSSRVLGLGALIQHIAVEIQFLEETESGLLEDLQECHQDQKGGV